jgi:hypothetical protein
MTRAILGIGLLITAILSTPANAASRHRHYVSASLSGLPSDCLRAASMGGPCGCHTEDYFFHRTDHVLNGVNMWLANGWFAFRRTAPGPGTAAIWPGRHVAPVVAVNGSTVTVADYFGTREVRMAGLVFVDPFSRR